MDKQKLLYDMCKETFNDINIYIQRPSLKNVKYPCIIIDLVNVNIENADNRPYLLDMVYSVTLIRNEYKEEDIKKLVELEKASFISNYIVDNLYHTQINITL